MRAQVFLSLREAAKRFGATTSEVREVYRQLGKERILRTIRGSHTMLMGRRAGRILKVNGVIGIPVSLRRFMTMRDYRVCFLKTREELHACGFATQSFFFEQSEASPDLLIAKLEKAGVDAALWLLPDGADRETGPRLRDRGIQFIGVNLAESSGVPCRYVVRRREAIRAILRSWRRDPNISGAVILRTGGESAPEVLRLERLRELVEAEKLDCEVISIPHSNAERFLQTLGAGSGRGIVLPAPAGSLLASQAPEELAEVLLTCRVALVDGPLDVLLAHEAQADIVTVNWAPIAKRIAGGAASGEALDEEQPEVFKAAARPRTPLLKLGRA
jgi:hypothetical protein